MARAQDDDGRVEAQRGKAGATLSGAQGPVVLITAVQILEGDVGLGAHRMQRQLIAVGQAHVLLAVGQPNGQQPEQGAPGFPQV